MKVMNSKKRLSKKVSKPSGQKRVDVASLDESFNELHRTRLTKSAAQTRKAAKIVSTTAKIPLATRESLNKTSDDLANLLKDF